MSFRVEAKENSATGVRARTTFGVGEEVWFIAPRPVQWSVGGNRNPSEKATHVFTAAGRTTVEAREGGRIVWTSPEINIVAPRIRYSLSRALRPIPNHVGVSVELIVQLTPVEVSFSHLQIRERKCPPSSVWGYFRENQNWFGKEMIHNPARGGSAAVPSWTQIDAMNLAVSLDMAQFLVPDSGLGRVLPTPYTPGGFNWLIPIEYRLGTQVVRFSRLVPQTFTIDPQRRSTGRPFRGRFTLTKGSVRRIESFA